MTWKRICNAADVPKNTVKHFKVGGIALVVVNYGDGFRVMPPVCPHMEEPLAESGVVANCVMTCTKHLWAWDLRTMARVGETEKPLQTYEVRQDNGEIHANLDKEIVYEFDDADDMDDDDFFKKA